MPDTLVGATIQAADFPPSAYAADTTSIANITTTTFTAGSPVNSLTFVAPTSGAVLLSVGLSSRDNSSTNRVHLAPVVRLGSSGGSTVLSANVVTRGVGTPGGITNYVYRSRTTILTGLTGGSTYYVETQYKVSGGMTADLQVRDITVCPIPLGSSFAGRPVRALDYPPPAWAQDVSRIDNPSNSSYITGSPEVSVTFIAPTSGRVLLIVGGALGNSSGADRIFLSPEVRETNASGALVLSPSVTNRGFGSDAVATGFHYGSRESVLEGLTPGQLYYAVVKYVVATGDAGASSGDIDARDIGVVPLP